MATQTHRRARRAAIGAIGMAAVLAAACAGTPPPPTAYQQADEAGYGFREEALGSERFQVTFRGNESTPREEVEANLLYRMAELTLERGAPRFTVLVEGTDCITTLQVSPTTTCTYRQSTDAMFPYFLMERDSRRFGGRTMRQEYEATAFMRLGGAAPCLEVEQCYEAEVVLARRSEAEEARAGEG